jgi:hypothetical protein
MNGARVDRVVVLQGAVGQRSVDGAHAEEHASCPGAVVGEAAALPDQL